MNIYVREREKERERHVERNLSLITAKSINYTFNSKDAFENSMLREIHIAGQNNKYK